MGSHETGLTCICISCFICLIVLPIFHVSCSSPVYLHFILSHILPEFHATCVSSIPSHLPNMYFIPCVLTAFTLKLVSYFISHVSHVLLYIPSQSYGCLTCIPSDLSYLYYIRPVSLLFHLPYLTCISSHLYSINPISYLTSIVPHLYSILCVYIYSISLVNIPPSQLVFHLICMYFTLSHFISLSIQILHLTCLCIP